MKTYQLTYSTNPFGDDLLDRLMETGDVTVSSHGDLNLISVDVDAETPDDAAQAGARFLAQHQVHVRRLEADLVNRAEIAERAEVSRAAVTGWVQGKREPNGFPPQHAWVGGPVWLWSEVLEWLQRCRGRLLDEPSGIPIEAVDRFNVAWAQQRSRVWRVPARESRTVVVETVQHVRVGWNVHV